MVSEMERTKILEMIENGTISAEDGLSLLNALDDSSEMDYSTLIDSDSTKDSESLLSESEKEDDSYENIEDAVDINSKSTVPMDDIQRWKRWWVIPLWIGAGITVLGGLLMFWAFQSNGLGFWFACAWFPFLLGVGLLAFAWNSRTSPWIHIRIDQKTGKSPQRIAFSLPIPIRLSVWGLRLFGHHIPHMEGVDLDEVILALKDVADDETPLLVDVEDDDDGDRVRVFIG
jgi:hypothetical protein